MFNLKKLFIGYIDITIFLFLILAKVLSYGKQLNPLYFSYSAILPQVVSSIILIIALSFLIKAKHRPGFLFFCNFIITLFIIGDLTYFRYFKDVISIPVLINGVMLGAVGSSVGSLFHLTDLLYGIDLITIYPLVMIIKKIKKPEEVSLTLKNKAAVFFTLALIGCSINGISLYTLSKEQPRLISTMYNRVYVVQKLGTLNYHYLDAFYSLTSSISRRIPISQATENQIKTFLNTNKSTTQNYFAKEKGKNLIIIQVEALQQFAINSTVQGQEVTPNLNKFLGRSLYFDNYYYQIAAGGTSDAEFISNNSLYPAASGAAYFLYAGNHFNSLPQVLKSQGYTTAALHGYNETFWNRNVMYKNFQFDNFFSEKDYNIDETVGLGLSDKSFLNQSVDKIKSLKQPYYSFVITLSSHYPYDDTKNYGNFDVGSLDGTLLGNYLKAIHYTDEQLGMFLDKLDKEGILKDSVVVIYGDHSAITKDNAEQLAEFKNISSMNDLSWISLQKVPLIVHFPDESIKGVNSTYSGQIDLYPTLANLFGINVNSLMGEDILNTKSGNVIFRNGSFINDSVYYNSQSNTYYNVKTGMVLAETAELKDKKEEVLNKLGYSDNILKHDLLKKFDSK
jgi:lipoteichoic acid synthase